MRIPEPTPDDSAREDDATAALISGQRERVAAHKVNREEPTELTEFFDPPEDPAPPVDRTPVFQRMFQALLDPRSIQYLLMFGGGLAVLGLVVWLVSLGVFKDPLVLAVTMGLATLAVLFAGWFVTLKTRYRVAGQALTFLACVIAPLNLWFYHAQGLVVLEDNLWIGGIACSLLFAATVYILRDPVFLYAVEAGLTLTVVLFLGQYGRAGDVSYASLSLMVLGLISLHAERAFSPNDDNAFGRRRFGPPLFWSAQVQIGVSLLLLLVTQSLDWIYGPDLSSFGLTFGGTLFTQSLLLSGGLWIAGTYAYLYSDFVVRRNGWYVLPAAFCLVMAEVTLLAPRLQGEALIAVLALTALAANLSRFWLLKKEAGAEEDGAEQDGKVANAVPVLALGLSVLPVLMGVGIHIRATSTLAEALDWAYSPGWSFVLAMVVVAVSNRISAFLYRRVEPRWSPVYFFFSAAGLVVAAAGLLRVLGLERWTHQAPLLMLIPLAYIAASRFWRGRSPERPLYWVAQASTAVILIHVLGASLVYAEQTLQAVKTQTANLLLGLVFVEAAVFYCLAGLFRRHGSNVYLAAAASCGALWQLMVYFGVPGAYSTMLFALLGLAFLFAARILGLEYIPIYRPDDEQAKRLTGRGVTAFHSGTAILWIALLAAFLQGATRILTEGVDWVEFTALVLTTVVSLVAIPVVPAGNQRRLFATAAVALGGVAFMTLNVLIDVSPWRKVEIYSVAAGVVLLVLAHVGRFREEDGSQIDGVDLALVLGSLLTAVPLLIAVCYHRFAGEGPSLVDEFALLTATILMAGSGVAWRIRATTLFGGVSLAVYLVLLISSLAYRPQVAVGVYLAVGGAIVFGAGILLSIYREKLLKLPEQIANREGVFQVMNWR